MQLHITTNADEVIARLLVVPTLMQGSLFDAMGRSLDSMQYYAVDYMWSNFKNPTGQLEDAFYQVIEDAGSGVQGELVNPLDYAWRRERGFSGMTDSLGRTYQYDPGIEYMGHTLEDQTPVAETIFTDSIGQVLAGI